MIVLFRFRNILLLMWCGLMCFCSCFSEVIVRSVVNFDMMELLKVFFRKLFISFVVFLLVFSVILLVKLLVMIIFIWFEGRLLFLIKLIQLKLFVLDILVISLCVCFSLVWFLCFLVLIFSKFMWGWDRFRLLWVQDVFISVQVSRFLVLVWILVFIFSMMLKFCGLCEGYRQVMVGWFMFGSLCRCSIDSVISVLVLLQEMVIVVLF